MTARFGHAVFVESVPSRRATALPRAPLARDSGARRAFVGTAWVLAWTLAWASALLMFATRGHAQAPECTAAGAVSAPADVGAGARSMAGRCEPGAGKRHVLPALDRDHPGRTLSARPGKS